MAASWTAVLYGRWRLALRSRLAEEGFKPPRGALAEDRRLERRGKGAAGPRQVWTGKMSDEREFSAVDVSKLSQVTSEPRPEVSLGMNLGDIRLLPRWCPAYRQHEPGPGSRTERVKACPDTVRLVTGERESSKRRNPQGAEYRCGDAGGLARSSCDPPAYRSGWGSEGAGSSGLADAVNREGGTAWVSHGCRASRMTSPSS